MVYRYRPLLMPQVLFAQWLFLSNLNKLSLSLISSDIETNECLHRNGGCWRDEATNVTACQDTYRGRVCECPVVNGVRYEGDGYTDCKRKMVLFV
jgi:hypothetical protein